MNGNLWKVEAQWWRPILTTAMSITFKRIEICRNWQFRGADHDDENDNYKEKKLTWMPVAAVPTNVHLDLLANGR